MEAGVALRFHRMRSRRKLCSQAKAAFDDAPQASERSADVAAIHRSRDASPDFARGLRRVNSQRRRPVRLQYVPSFRERRRRGQR